MERKTLVWIGLAVGSTMGGLIPTLFGGSALGFWSVILTALGGIAGIAIGFKLGS